MSNRKLPNTAKIRRRHLYAQCSPETVRRAPVTAVSQSLPEQAQAAVHNFSQSLVAREELPLTPDAIKIRPGPMCLEALRQSPFFQAYRPQQAELQVA